MRTTTTTTMLIPSKATTIFAIAVAIALAMPMADWADVITGTNEDDVINGCAETTRLMDLMEMTGLKAAEAMTG
jgi:hypothetical protein